MQAALHGNLAVLKRLLPAYDAIMANCEDAEGRKLLHHAVRNKDNLTSGVIECLLERGAAVNAKDENGLTPLDHAALIDQHDEMVGKLRGLGAETGILLRKINYITHVTLFVRAIERRPEYDSHVPMKKRRR